MAITTQSVGVLDKANSAQSFSVAKDAAGLFRSVFAPDERGAAFYGASALFTPQATGAVTVISIKGSASTTVRVRLIMMQQLGTSVGQGTWAIQRTTALGAGGTAVNPTFAKLDSGSAAATLGATNIAHYTSTLKAAGTAGDGPLTTFTLSATLLQGSTPTALSGPQMVQIWPQPGTFQTSIVLRGASDFIEIQNVNAGNLVAGSQIAYSILWEEDGS